MMFGFTGADHFETVGHRRRTTIGPPEVDDARRIDPSSEKHWGPGDDE
jgi:hypothetical protein